MAFGASLTAVQYFGDTDTVFRSNFALAPDAAPFQTHGAGLEQQIEFDAAFEYASRSGLAVNAAVFGETGDLDMIGARIGVSKRF